MKILAWNRVWVLMLALGLEIILGICVYFFRIRALELNNLNLEKNISAEKILENKCLKNIEQLKLKNRADQPSKIIFNDLMRGLPHQDSLESVIFNLSEQASLFGFKDFDIKLAGLSLLNLGQEPENLGLVTFHLSMTGTYLNFISFYQQGILKKYPVINMRNIELKKNLNLNQSLEIQLDLGFMLLRQISD